MHHATIKARIRSLEMGSCQMVNGHQVYRIDEFWYTVGMSPTRRTYLESCRMASIPRITPTIKDSKRGNER
jgi:hypothetical protein